MVMHVLYMSIGHEFFFSLYLFDCVIQLILFWHHFTIICFSCSQQPSLLLPEVLLLLQDQDFMARAHIHHHDSFKQNNALKISSVHICHTIYRVGIGIIQESNLSPALQVVPPRSHGKSVYQVGRGYFCEIGFSRKLLTTLLPCKMEVRNLESTTFIFMYTSSQV